MFTANQKDDLTNQVNFLRGFANARGIIIDETIKDLGSGLNYNRKKCNRLLDDCKKNAVDTVIISHKDRFVRFGYDWFERFLAKFYVKLIVVNNELHSPQ